MRGSAVLRAALVVKFNWVEWADIIQFGTQYKAI